MTSTSRNSAEKQELLNYAEEIQKLDELQQMMVELDDQIKESRLQSELLNLDIATMFDPDDIVRAKELSIDCVNCLEKDDQLQLVEDNAMAREN
ncbi:hypothetical protein ACHWQZ_G010172 [Mnemiopsis leidyi]